MKRVLLLGGGHAHVHVLQAFAQEPLAGGEALLVTPFARQMYSGMVPGLVAGHYRTDECVIPLPPLAKRGRVRFEEGAAVALDAARREVTLANGDVLHYDVLSVDTGPVMDRDLIPGAREHGLFVRPIEHFVQLFDRMMDLAATRPIDLVIVGGGAAGVELALALSWRLRREGAPDSRISLVSGPVPPLDGFAPRVRQRALAALKRERITVLNDSCVAVAADHVRLAQGTRVACDAPVMAIGASAPTWLAGSGLALDERGFIATGATLQSTSHPEVFAAGDVATRVDAPHPKSGVYAVRAGPPLAHNLRRFVGGGEMSPYTPQRRTLYLLSLGTKRAVASWGPLSAEGTWVWRWKDHIDRAFIARYVPAQLGPVATRQPGDQTGD